MDAFAGSVIDHRFELREVAGRGGMGTAYRALDRQTEGQVALEIMHADAGGQPEAALVAAGKAYAEREPLGRLDSGDVQVDWVCAEGLLAAGRDAEARPVLEAARARLIEAAGRIHDADLRASFLGAVSDHARLLALAARHCDA